MKVTAIKNMLMAQDIPRAIKFYRNAFDFDLKLESDHWCELTKGDCIVALHGGHDGSENRVSLCIEVDEIKLFIARIALAGGKIVVTPMQREGEPIIYSEFADTEGNIAMLTQYVGG